jgi:hypothetical protein
MTLLVLIGLVPAAAAHATASNSVTDRVSRIRLVLREQMGNPVAVQESPESTELAQWGNAWTNWNNWNNWRNWNNWANWGNWGNWGNIG